MPINTDDITTVLSTKIDNEINRAVDTENTLCSVIQTSVDTIQNVYDTTVDNIKIIDTLLSGVPKVDPTISASISALSSDVGVLSSSVGSMGSTVNTLNTTVTTLSDTVAPLSVITVNPDKLTLPHASFGDAFEVVLPHMNMTPYMGLGYYYSPNNHQSGYGFGVECEQFEVLAGTNLDSVISSSDYGFTIKASQYMTGMFELDFTGYGDTGISCDIYNDHKMTIAYDGPGGSGVEDDALYIKSSTNMYITAKENMGISSDVLNITPKSNLNVTAKETIINCASPTLGTTFETLRINDMGINLWSYGKFLFNGEEQYQTYIEADPSTGMISLYNNNNALRLGVDEVSITFNGTTYSAVEEVVNGKKRLVFEEA